MISTLLRRLGYLEWRKLSLHWIIDVTKFKTSLTLRNLGTFFLLFYNCYLFVQYQCINGLVHVWKSLLYFFTRTKHIFVVLKVTTPIQFLLPTGLMVRTELICLTLVTLMRWKRDSSNYYIPWEGGWRIERSRKYVSCELYGSQMERWIIWQLKNRVK